MKRNGTLDYTEMRQKGEDCTSYFWRLVRMKKDFRNMDWRRQNELTEHADKVIDQLEKSIKAPISNHHESKIQICA